MNEESQVHEAESGGGIERSSLLKRFDVECRQGKVPAGILLPSARLLV